jgi:hypothetical protein
MHQFFMLPEEVAVCINGPGRVRDDGDDGGELARAHLPYVQVSHQGVTVAFDSPPNDPPSSWR